MARKPNTPAPAVKYPLINKLVDEVMYDSYGSLMGQYVKPQAEWDWDAPNLTPHLPATMAELERQAGTLTADELDTMGSGDDYDQQKIVARRRVQALQAFINEVFDGLTPLCGVPRKPDPILARKAKRKRPPSCGR